MPPKPPRAKPEKPVAAEWSWGECPAGHPETAWEHSARPLWAQVLPGQESVLLLEKTRFVLRRLANGLTVWEGKLTDLPDELAHDGAGVVLGTDRDLREIDARKGGDRWRLRLGAAVTGMALTPDTVYVSSRGPLFAVSRADGKQRWRVPCASEPELHAYPEASLVVVDDPETETIIALETENGQRRWSHAAEGQPVAAGPLFEGLIPISRHAAGAAAVDAATGETRWSLESEGAWEQPPALLNGTYYFTDGQVWAVEAATGAVRWQRALEEEEDKIFSVRLVEGIGDAEPLLLAESWRGRLLALSPVDGALRWERRPGQAHGLTWDEQHVYLRLNVSQEDTGWAVAALVRASGNLAWELRAPRLISDVTRVGKLLVVELRSTVLVLDLSVRV